MSQTITTSTSPKKKPKQTDEERKAKANARAKRWYAENQEKGKARAKQWAQDFPEARQGIARASYLRKAYGMTVEAFDAMFAAQNGVCAICEGDNSASKVNWHVDHCHANGHVRGILCHHCNVMLGMASDNPSTLSAAIAYLERTGDGAKAKAA